VIGGVYTLSLLKSQDTYGRSEHGRSVVSILDVAEVSHRVCDRVIVSTNRMLSIIAIGLQWQNINIPDAFVIRIGLVEHREVSESCTWIEHVRAHIVA